MSGALLMDDLARALAQPMPRRRALRVLGTSLAVALVPGVRSSWAGVAPHRSGQNCKILAPQERCLKGERRCDARQGGRYLGNFCCPDGEFKVCGSTPCSCIDKCKLAGRGLGTGAWDRCGKLGLCCHPTKQACRRGECVLCKPGPLCSGKCCPLGETCLKCIESQQGSVIWFVKGARKCCPPGSECCGSRCVKESLGRACCDGKVCAPGKRCVNLDPSTSGRVGLTCG